MIDESKDGLIRLLKISLTGVSLLIFSSGIIVYIFSTSKYVFSSPSLTADTVVCYQNFTNNMKNNSSIYSFDWFVIVSQPIVIIFLSLMVAIFGNNLGQFEIILFTIIGIFGTLIYFLVFGIVYYSIARLYCSDYWFCITPCVNTFGIESVPTFEFLFSYISHIVFFILAILSISTIAIVTSIRNSEISEKRSFFLGTNYNLNKKKNYKLLNKNKIKNKNNNQFTDSNNSSSSDELTSSDED